MSTIAAGRCAPRSRGRRSARHLTDHVPHELAVAGLDASRRPPRSGRPGRTCRRGTRRATRSRTTSSRPRPRCGCAARRRRRSTGAQPSSPARTSPRLQARPQPRPHLWTTANDLHDRQARRAMPVQQSPRAAGSAGPGGSERPARRTRPFRGWPEHRSTRLPGQDKADDVHPGQGLSARFARCERCPLASSAGEEAMSEAHVPAQQPQTRQTARLPASDVDPRRPGDRAGAAAQGPPPPVGLIWRVHDRATFAALRRSGCRVTRGPITITWVPGNSTEPPRVAYAVGRAVGRAVVRNRIRRRLRAITAESCSPPSSRGLPHSCRAGRSGPVLWRAERNRVHRPSGPPRPPE